MWYGAGALWNSISHPEPERDQARDRERAVGHDVRVDHEQGDAEQDQREPGPGDRQHREAEERGEQRHRAERARQHDAGMEDLEADAGDARRGRAG